MEKLQIRLLKKLQTINIDHEKTCNNLQFPRCERDGRSSLGGSFFCDVFGSDSGIIKVLNAGSLCTDLILHHHVISSGTLQLAATCLLKLLFDSCSCNT